MKAKLSKRAVPAVITVMLLIAGFLPAQVWAARFPETGSFADGAKAWADNCVRCHNMRDPQDLRDDQWVTTAFHMRVRAGLTGQQTRDILTFLQESNNPAVPAPASMAAAAPAAAGASGRSGEAVYLQTCVACHGPEGRGAIPGTPDLTGPDGPLTKPDAELMRNVTEGFQSPGSPMAMPPKGGNPALTTADIQAVLDYMRREFLP